MANDNYEIFSGTTLSDLMKDIYINSKSKSKQIDTLIRSLEPLIKNITDATIIVPLIKEYLDVAVKNDDSLIKLGQIVQRLIASDKRASSAGGDNEFGLTEEERRRLLEEAEEELSRLTIEDPKESNVISDAKHDDRASGSIGNNV